MDETIHDRLKAHHENRFGFELGFIHDKQELDAFCVKVDQVEPITVFKMYVTNYTDDFMSLEKVLAPEDEDGDDYLPEVEIPKVCIAVRRSLDHEIVGVMFISPAFHEVDLLYVLPAYRGRGFGKKLLTAMQALYEEESRGFGLQAIPEKFYYYYSLGFRFEDVEFQEEYPTSEAMYAFHQRIVEADSKGLYVTCEGEDVIAQAMKWRAASEEYPASVAGTAWELSAAAQENLVPCQALPPAFFEETYDELDGLPSELPLLSAEDVMAMDEADDV